MTRAVTGQAPAGAGVAFVLAASILWGTTGTVATFAPDVGPLAIGAAAMGVGGLLQALSAGRLIRQFRVLLGAHRRMVALGAVAVAIYPLAFYSSMHLAGVAVGTVVSLGSAPLASALIERVVDGRKLTKQWMGGAALGVSGAVLLCAAQAGAAHQGDAPASPGATLAGIALGFVAGATYALYSWAAHRIMRRGVPARAAMGAIFGVGGLLLLPVLAATGAPLLSSWSNAAVGSYLAFVPMFAGYVLFGWGLGRVAASTATTVSLAEPVVAAILAVAIVGEQLPAPGWAGMGLILAGVTVLSLPGNPRRRRPPEPEPAELEPAVAGSLLATVPAALPGDPGSSSR